MNRLIRALLIFVSALILLSACSASFEEKRLEAKQEAQDSFKESPKKPNQHKKQISFYMPFGYEIKKEEPNNLLLKNGSKTYILFFNTHEQPKSKVVYEATVEQRKNSYEVNESFKKDSKFGFLLIKKLNKDMNELTVGIGGIKITSEVPTESLPSEAAAMMKIAASVKFAGDEG